MYPDLLEQYWIRRACRALGTQQPAQALQGLVPSVAALSELFTTERPEAFGRYGDDERMQLAYGLFFFPRTYERIRLILDEAAGGWMPPGDEAVRVLDLGAGLGAATCAAAGALAGREAVFHAIDHAAASLRTLEDLFASARTALWPRARLTTACGGLEHAPRVDGGWHLILVSFAMNEALQGRSDEDVQAWADRLISLLAPEGLLILCEPALRETAERLGRLRDRLVASRAARLMGPCPHHLPCPMLRQSRTWCHEVRRWPVPGSLAYLNTTLHREVAVVKFSFLALSRSAPDTPAADPARARLVAAFTEENGKFTTRGCAADGAIHTYEILARHLDRAARQAARDLERGTRVRWPDLAPLGNGALRSASLPQPQDPPR